MNKQDIESVNEQFGKISKSLFTILDVIKNEDLYDITARELAVEMIENLTYEIPTIVVDDKELWDV